MSDQVWQTGVPLVGVDAAVGAPSAEDVFDPAALDGEVPSCLARAAGLQCSCDVIVPGERTEFDLAEPAACEWLPRLTAARGMQDRLGHPAVIATLAPEPRHALTRPRLEFLVGPSVEAAEKVARTITAGMDPHTAGSVTLWLLRQWRGVATRDAARHEAVVVVDRDVLHRLRRSRPRSARH
jgi:hypothetical protein